jgi:hypothetical protein
MELAAHVFLPQHQRPVVPELFCRAESIICGQRSPAGVNGYHSELRGRLSRISTKYRYNFTPKHNHRR